MAIKNNKNKRILIFAVIAAVLLIALAAIVYLVISGTDKNEQDEQVTIEDLTEAIEEPVEEVVTIDPKEVMASAVYKDGLLSRAKQFKDDCATIYSDTTDDLARFSLIDIDKDGIDDLIMHDVPGKRAYYCSYAGDSITEPFEIFIDENSDDSSYIPGAYAALYLEKNLFIKYVVSGNYDRTEAYLYKVNEETKAPELVGSVVTQKDSEGNHTYFGSDGQTISEDEYLAVFKDALGDDYGYYFLDELKIADGEYDFKTQYTFNSTAAISHMTLEEFSAKIGG